DITGARWTMRGAEAVLPLGSLYISGDWHEYWQFHLQQEHKRNHLALYSSGIFLIKPVLKARCSTTPPPLPIPV
ncbi:MAG: ISKra4 family transposase, partial [Richelia sp.]|nr:ISKra4 family transposase [Richelia sp.]